MLSHDLHMHAPCLGEVSGVVLDQHDTTFACNLGHSDHTMKVTLEYLLVREGGREKEGEGRE